ncbi:MAG: hypothetical protein AAFX98_07850, partial [Pseudomonadota bacterium]
MEAVGPGTQDGGKLQASARAHRLLERFLNFACPLAWFDADWVATFKDECTDIDGIALRVLGQLAVRLVVATTADIG